MPGPLLLVPVEHLLPSSYFFHICWIQELSCTPFSPASKCSTLNFQDPSGSFSEVRDNYRNPKPDSKFNFSTRFEYFELQYLDDNSAPIRVMSITLANGIIVMP